MSRRIPLSAVGDGSNRGRIFMVHSVVGALVTQGGRLDTPTLFDALMPACIPPFLLEGAKAVIARGIVDAEEAEMVVKLGPRVVLTIAGMECGAKLFEVIVQGMEDERKEREAEEGHRDDQDAPG